MSNIDWRQVRTAEDKEAAQTAEAREQFKSERAAAVKAITVTTVAGNTFDGDEESQGRMARAILALPEGGKVPWVLADNSVIQATADDLREALALAGAEQARLWVQES